MNKQDANTETEAAAKAAADETPGYKNIPLSKEYEHQGRKYNSLSMRTEIFARDQINVGHMHANPALQEATLFANLCEVPEELIGKLKLLDFMEVQKTYMTAVGEELKPRKT